MISDIVKKMHKLVDQETTMTYDAVRTLPTGYFRQVSGSVTTHEFRGRLPDGAYVVAECRFDQRERALMDVNTFTVDIREPGKLLSIADRRLDYTHLPELFEPSVQLIFDKLRRLIHALNVNGDRHYFTNVDVYNELTGLDARVVEVDGVHFGCLLPNFAGLPPIASRLVLLDDWADLSGRRVLTLAREARKVLNPELRDVKTIADVLELLDGFDVTYADTKAAVVFGGLTDASQSGFGVDGFPELNIKMVDDEPLVLSTKTCETIDVPNDEIQRAVNLFSRTTFTEARRRKMTVDALLGA